MALALVASLFAACCTSAAAVVARPAAFWGQHAPAFCPGAASTDDVLGNVSLAGKFAVVTGGSSGLGYATALALAKRGATVVIGNRNEADGLKASRSISEATGSKVIALPLDLSFHTTVRSFAKQVLEEFGGKLNILVNNGGVHSPSEMTDDGHEFVFQVDHLGHVLLTELLLPALRANAPSHIVNVASGAHERACVSAGFASDCFKDFTYLPPPVVFEKDVKLPGKTLKLSASSYGIAKFANIQHAAGLAQREAANGIEAYSVNPGLVQTEFTTDADPADPFILTIPMRQQFPVGLPEQPCPFSPDQGAAVIVMCATGREGLVNGGYYDRMVACGPGRVSKQGFSDDMVSEFYDRSLQMAGLKDVREH